MADKDSPARSAAVEIVKTLRAAGYVAYLAGGCVRDALLGLEPKDYDVATSAVPKKVREIFPASRFVGEAFGVVLVRKFSINVEVATFRQESGYKDGRHPRQICFTDAQHDAQRRDFTINGLFADPLEQDKTTGGSEKLVARGSGSCLKAHGQDAHVTEYGFSEHLTGQDKIIDYVGGLKDLKAGLVRAIGDPKQRFGEDYLRMLRAPRFAARLGFEIEPATAAAIVPLADNLKNISRQRIGQEVEFMLTGKNGAHAATLIEQLRLDGPALGEAHLDCQLTALSKAGSNLPWPLALALWMIDRQVTRQESQAVARFCQNQARAIAVRWRKALNLSNQVRDELVGMMRAAGKGYDWANMNKAQRKRLLASSSWPVALRLWECVLAGQKEPGRWLDQLKQDAQPLYKEGVCPRPFVDGSDLIALGASPGPQFSYLLHEVYDAQLEGILQTRQQALNWLKTNSKR